MAGGCVVAVTGARLGGGSGVGWVTGVVVGVEVVVVGGATGADDFPLESTANQSFSTPCPLAWPLFLSLMNV